MKSDAEAWNEDSIRKIEASLRGLLKAESVEVADESRAHAGHAGARGGGHCRVFVVSAAFEGLSRIERHRAVYAAIEASGVQVHAASIRAVTPAEERRITG